MDKEIQSLALALALFVLTMASLYMATVAFCWSFYIPFHHRYAVGAGISWCVLRMIRK